MIKNKISNPTFHYNTDYYWTPSTDIARLPYDNKSDFYKGLVVEEDLNHRFLLMGSDIGFQIQWQELLSNIEFLNIVRDTAKINLKLKIPLEDNLVSIKLPDSIKWRIKYLIDAMKIIDYYTSTISLLIEALAVIFIENTYKAIIENSESNKENFQDYKQNHFKYYSGLEETYNNLTKIIDKIGWQNSGTLVPYLLNTTNKEYLPPLSIADSFGTFNVKIADHITNKWKKLGSNPEILSHFKPDSFFNNSFYSAYNTVSSTLECVVGLDLLPHLQSILIPSFNNLHTQCKNPIDDIKKDLKKFLETYKEIASPSIIFDPQGNKTTKVFINSNVDRPNLVNLVITQVLEDIKYTMIEPTTKGIILPDDDFVNQFLTDPYYLSDTIIEWTKEHCKNMIK